MKDKPLLEKWRNNIEHFEKLLDIYEIVPIGKIDEDSQKFGQIDGQLDVARTYKDDVIEAVRELHRDIKVELDGMRHCFASVRKRKQVEEELLKVVKEVFGKEVDS